VVALHVLAVPAAIILATLLGLAWAAAAGHTTVDLALNETMFVVVHFHVGLLLLAWVAACTFVSWRYGVVSTPLRIGLVVTAVHFVVALGLWLGGAPEPPVALRPHVGWTYLLSAATGFLLVAIGLILSLVRTLNSAKTS